MTVKEKVLIASMIAGVAVFHYFIPRDSTAVHILFRFLYLVPISYAALYNGRRVGVITAIIVTLVFLPHFFIPEISHEFVAGNIGAIILFNLTGFFVGSFRDKSEREVSEQKRKLQIVSRHDGEGSNVLFYADNTQLGTVTAEWFTDIFGSSVESVTILSVYNEDEREKFSSLQEAEECVSRRKKEIAAYTKHIKDEIINRGIDPDKITIKPATIEGKKSISDKILDELKTGGYDLVLLPKHEKTHAQEFLFGDTAVQLLRKASIPVLSVKGSLEKLTE